MFGSDLAELFADYVQAEGDEPADVAYLCALFDEALLAARSGEPLVFEAIDGLQAGFARL